MNKYITSFIFAFSIYLFHAGNTNKPKPFVSGKDVFGTRNFIENKGQYDKALSGDYKIEAVLDNGQEKIYFTTKGLVYELIKRFRITKEQREAIEKDKHYKLKEPKIYHVNMNWLNTNPNISVEKSEQQNHYFTYGEAKYNSYAYKKLTYKNVYQNIDIEYTIPEDKEYGIKYNVIVHPGANVNDIKIAYSGDVEKIRQTEDGNILIKTPLDDITEHAPTTFYENKQQVKSMFSLTDGIIGFNLPKGYEQNKTLIIDPFVSAVTTLSASNLAYDVDYDYSGNVYVYGGDETLYNAKYNSAGTLQWTFTGILIIPSWSGGFDAGNFVVNKSTSKTYIAQGFNYNGTQIIRLDALGNYDNFITNANPSYTEIWDMGFYCVNNDVFGLGGSPTSNLSGMLIDQSTATTTLSTFQPTITSYQHDVVSHAIDDIGNLFVIYASNPLSSYSGGGILDNKICSVNTGFNGNNWTQPSNYSSLSESYNKLNYIGIQTSGNSFNCLAVNANYLFYYDGFNLAAYNKTTGSLTASTTIPALALMQQGGIAVDDCNNLYLGGNGSVLSYNFNGTNFTALTSIPLSSASANPYVFDIKLDKRNNLLFVSGNSFVGAYIAINSTTLGSITPFTYSVLPSACSTVSFTAPNYSLACLSASAVSLSWLFGDSASGLANTSTLANPIHFYSSPGTYTVKLLFNYYCGTDTIIQTIVVNRFSIASSFPNCILNATITPCAANSYSYTWLPSGRFGGIRFKSGGLYYNSY